MAVACVVLAWSAGPALAAGALDGVVAATPAATAPAPAAAVQQAATSLQRPNEPVRSVARPAVAPAREVARRAVTAPQQAVADAPVPSAPVATEPRPNPAVSAAPVLKSGADAVSAAPVLNASTPAAHRPAGDPRKAAAGHVRATAASLADRRKQRATGGLSAAQIPTTIGLPQLVLLASGKAPSATTASGWRNRTPVGTRHPQGQLGMPPVNGSGGATSVAAASSAAASSAAASAAGLLGLLLLLTFAAQRLGGLIRLRPDWAPPAPFLALHERPG